ncbi:hypothetical protein ACW17M_06850 [Vreelandella sp. 2A-K22]
MRLALRASLQLGKFIPDKFVVSKASIGGHDGPDAQLLKTRFNLLQNWLQGVMFLAFIKGLTSMMI